ncbi:MAG: helix-turn-helix transcriptional regulator [Terriglobales bacterium]
MPLTITSEMPAKKIPKTSFGERLFALRTARGLTQVDLAKATGTTQRVISYYETKGELPTPDFLVALVRILGTTADELLGIKPAKLGPDNTPEQRRLWKRFQRMESLPEKDQRAVVRLINSLVASNGNGHSRGSVHP